MTGHDGFSSQSREFDQYADGYLRMHKVNIAASGEDPEYFAAYKVAEVARCLDGRQIESILDFGSGIGGSMPYFRQYFPGAELICADVSGRSLEVAMSRFPGLGRPLLIPHERIDLPDSSMDLVFTACVFHHVQEREHVHWLGELRRVTRPGGYFALFEHNPLNPLTVHAVNTCPFDVNARLQRAGRLRRVMLAAGWNDVVIRYHVFFPRALAFARPLERVLSWLPLGAQYSIMAHA